MKKNEVSEVKKALLDPALVDYSPREIYYKILDEEQRIIASVSSFYRIARNENLLTRRVKTNFGNKLNRETPHLLATSINQIWSWDVSQIRSTTRTIRYYLYVIMDIWSRFVVAWKLEDHEQTCHAIALWKQALENQQISGNGLINHKDNGSIMTSKEMIKFVKDTSMIDSYSRAGISDDNPFSEALFRTIKYFRNFPDCFDTIELGRDYFGVYFEDYNYTHKHSGIQFLTPGQRHFGEEEKILKIRNNIIEDFHRRNTHRYPSKHKVFMPIIKVKIN
ncbi:MAG: transposase [Oligoflexia bacterium]|nr:transposase [Oligoflexia bacterium]